MKLDWVLSRQLCGIVTRQFTGIFPLPDTSCASCQGQVQHDLSSNEKPLTVVLLFGQIKKILILHSYYNVFANWRDGRSQILPGYVFSYQLQEILHEFPSSYLWEHLHYVIDKAPIESVSGSKKSADKSPSRGRDVRAVLYSRIGLRKAKDLGKIHHGKLLYIFFYNHFIVL